MHLAFLSHFIMPLLALLSLMACFHPTIPTSPPPLLNSQPINQTLPPLVLVPGTGGNQLYIKLTDQYRSDSFLCRRNPWRTGYFRLWLNVPGVLPPFTRCFVDRMKLVYNSDIDQFQNVPGVESQVPYFGSTDGITYLDPNFKKLSTYMGPLVKSLETEGYVDGKSLLGAPYDFRYAPGKHAAPVAKTYLEDLKKLVEQAYSSNGNQKVVLVSHSLGGLWVLHFLNQQTLSWRQEYIKHFIAISGPWGGCVQAMRTCASGYTEGVPFVDPLILREEQRSSESNLWLLPVPSVFGNRSLVIATSKTYSALDLPEFFEDIGFLEGPYLYESRIPAITENLEAPRIPVTLIFSHGVATPETLVYGESGFDEQPKIVCGDGDGTVNLSSLSAVIEKWNRTTGQVLKVIEIPGKTHEGILTDDISVGVIVGEIMGQLTKPVLAA